MADGGAALPGRRAPTLDGGRDLLQVDALVIRWGAERHGAGKRVWALLRFTRSGATPDR